MHDIKLRPAITLVLLIGFLLPVLVVGWLTFIDQRNTLRRTLNDDQERILNILILGIQEPLWSLYPDKGEPLLDAVMTDSRVVRITVENEDGVFLEKIKEGADIGSVQTLSRRVTFHGRDIGQVIVDMDYGHLEAVFISQITRFLLIFLVPFALSSIVLFFLLRRKVITPMERLVRQSEDLAGKKLDTPFDWKQLDEIGILGKSLEKTRQSLQSAFRELELLHKQALNHSRVQEKINQKLQGEIDDRQLAEERLRQHRNLLEKKVEERTAELVEVNTSLVEQIEERQRAEEERNRIALKLHRAEKMEALGVLASGVAHDLNNILAGIVSYPELLLLKLDPSSELYQPIEEIQGAGKRAAAVVADLLTIARSTSTVLAPQDIHSIIEEYLGSPEHRRIEGSFPTISTHTEFTSAESVIDCSPVHIKKCLMNLFTNAYEASRQNSRITISTHRERSRYLDREEDCVVLSVCDSGPGIKESDLHRIFEPFYSTKQLGMSGSGLGLAVVWNTMEEHRGWVTAESSGEGSCFRLYFPAAKGKLGTAEKHKELNIRGNHESILVVDDEPLLLKIADRMLSGLGYVVHSATSGEDAVEFLQQNRVDAVILDMVMDPGMNGRQTYERILEIHPSQKAMVVSGFAMNDDIRAALDLGVATFLKKPYTIEELTTSLRRTLDSAHPGDNLVN